MQLHRLDPAGLASLEAAVRAGEPVELVGNPRAAVPLDEVVPLCHGVSSAALAEWLPPPARGGSGHRVSAIIPTHRQRPLGLGALAAQDVEVEVLVLANGDFTEGVRIPWEGHGRTRMEGVRMARHPWVLLTVDDAVPLGAGFVRSLVEAAEAGGYDAVVARQVPWPTADRVTRARLRAWTPPAHGHRPSPMLDNVCALYRREVLLADPFDDVPIAEDWHWGRRHRIGYLPDAPVVHSHERRFRSSFSRTRDLHRELHRGGEAPRVPDLVTLLGALPSTLGPDLRGALGELLGQYAARPR